MTKKNILFKIQCLQKIDLYNYAIIENHSQLITIFDRYYFYQFYQTFINSVSFFFFLIRIKNL